jgi:hypothetical protein
MQQQNRKPDDPSQRTRAASKARAAPTSTAISQARARVKPAAINWAAANPARSATSVDLPDPTRQGAAIAAAPFFKSRQTLQNLTPRRRNQTPRVPMATRGLTT